MRELIEAFKNSKHLSHAYGIEGDFDGVFPKLVSFFETELNEKLSGNPNAYIRETQYFSVDDAREVREVALLSNRGGGRKLVVLSFLSATREAQNALLKSIEEPSEGTHFFIITPILETLLPTLRSRLTLLKGVSSGVYEKQARVFLETPIPKRVALLKPFLGEEKDRAGALSFVVALQREVRGAEGMPLVIAKAETLATLERAVVDLRLSGASVKMVLEHIALTV